MPMISCAFSALAVASLFYMWRDYYWARLQRERLMRERVAYMLWAVAHLAE